jgi:hypothetical protein
MRTRTAVWYETTVRYDRQTEDGGQKKVSEVYVVDALSFGEAEEVITKEMEAFVTGEFDVKKIAIAPYTEVFFSEDEDDDKFFRATVAMITLDERTGKEKKTNVNYLVQAKNIETARRYVVDAFLNTRIDYEINRLVETKILDVFEK